MRSRTVSPLLSFLLLLSAGGLFAQEPAHTMGENAVRFRHPGYFHYVFPCRHGAMNSQPPALWTPGADALCFAVIASRVQIVDVKLKSSAVPQTLEISADEVRFIPWSASVENPVEHFDVAAVRYSHPAGKAYASIGNAGLAYDFAYQNKCQGCAGANGSGEVGSPAALDLEFDLIRDALQNFGPTAKRVVALASELRITIDPAHEPPEMASVAIMEHYAALNHELAASCPAEAASCVKSYEKFQTCKAGGDPGSCGTAPACRATCVLERMPALGTGKFPLTDEDDVVAIVPLAERVVKMLHMNGMGGGGVLGGMGAGTGGGAANAGMLRLPGGVVAGLVLTRVPPVYPPVARLAHVTGTVTLHAIISKEGRMERVEVISGPPLLVSSAMDAVKQWTYRPYLLNGEPTEVDTTVIVNFNLNANPEKAPAPATD